MEKKREREREADTHTERQRQLQRMKDLNLRKKLVDYISSFLIFSSFLVYAKNRILCMYFVFLCMYGQDKTIKHDIMNEKWRHTEMKPESKVDIDGGGIDR